jgi:hypothetical protein
MNITDEEQYINKLKDYFEYVDSSLLEIFDPEVANEDALERGGYTGVTAGYLFKYVIPGCSEDLFLKIINQLIEEKVVASIRCGDIGRDVFEKYISDDLHWRWLEDPEITKLHLYQSKYKETPFYSDDDEEE